MEQRTELIHLRLSKEEKEILKKKAVEKRLDVSNYIRFILFN